MDARQFFDWQTAGGASDVMRLIDLLERAALPWCFKGDIAVNHWAEEPMVTRDVELVVATDSVERAVELLVEQGFKAERFVWRVNLTGRSRVSIQLSTEAMYADFPSRSVAADVHGILMRVASLTDTMAGKVAAWRDDTPRGSKRIKDLGDIARLVESHPSLRDDLDVDILGVLDSAS